MKAIELNEAFSAVALGNIIELDLADKIAPVNELGETTGSGIRLNPYGGAIAIGHPLGASGARIVATLASHLQQEHGPGSYGIAAICNGGGGASAVLIQSL